MTFNLSQATTALVILVRQKEVATTHKYLVYECVLHSQIFSNHDDVT